MGKADISVITVVLNDADGLSKTIESIRAQKEVLIQHIIVDGGSSDGSQFLATKHSDIEVSSKRDGGIYQGMQRGAELATSDLIMFVNSSDQLEGSSNLSFAIQQMRNEKSAWGFGPILENTLRSTLRLSGGEGAINLKTIAYRKTFVPFPVVLIDRIEFLRVGGFSFKYKIAGDFDLIVRLAQKSTPTKWTYPLVRFAAGGVSYTKPITAWREEHFIRVNNLNLNVFQIQISYFIFLKRILRWVAGKGLDILQKNGLLGSNHWRDRH